MFRAARPTLNALKTPVGQRNYAKATLFGRLGGVPAVHRTASGKDYVLYSLAVSKPPKKDENGQIVLDTQGYPVRETNWFNIFNFRPSAIEYMPKLESGTQLLVEANLETRVAETEQGKSTDLLLREISHKVISKKRSA